MKTKNSVMKIQILVVNNESQPVKSNPAASENLSGAAILIFRSISEEVVCRCSAK